MKKPISLLLSTVIAFSGVFIVATPFDAETEAVAKKKVKKKTTKQLEREGYTKIKNYLYSQTSAYKKVRLFYTFKKTKNGSLTYQVYEDIGIKYNFVGDFKITKGSNYKKVYLRHYSTGKYKLVRK